MAFFAGAAVVFVGGMVGGKVVLNKINSIQEEEATRPRVVFVLGGPGSGKGTNCARVVKDYGYVHLSAGDLLRAERKSGTGLGDLIESLISQGKIVPSSITVKLLQQAVELERSKGNTKFLIDGFPRNQENLDLWNETIGDSYTVDFVLCLDCSEEVMEQRLLVRGATSGRSDDNAAAIRKRFATHVESTLPIIRHYEQLEGMLKTVDSGRGAEDVYRDVRAHFVNAGATKGLTYGFADGSDPAAAKAAAAADASYQGAGDDLEGGGDAVESKDAPVLFSVYEAADGFRGSYEEVIAHEKSLGL